jgi:hypothetical protein
MRATVTESVQASDPTPTPTIETFGLNSANGLWTASGNVLNAMGYQKTAGNGTLVTLELLFDDSIPIIRVRRAVYCWMPERSR